MPTAALVGILYCLLIAAVSLLGGLVPLALRLTHKRMEVALSFVAGAMLGVALLHLLPHAVLARAGHASMGGHDVIEPVALWLLAGFLAMFLVERFFCFHHHEATNDHGSGDCGAPRGHAHGDGAHACEREPSHHRLSWAGAAIGLTLHSLIEGVALAAAVSAEQHSVDDAHGAGWSVPALAGLGTLLVIALHKPFDSMTLGTLLAAGGWSARARHIANALFSLVVPIGAACFALGLGGASGSHGAVLSAALAFSAGTFLCISLSDLLPELQFHQHDRVKLSLALVLGLALAWGLSIAEGRVHGH